MAVHILKEQMAQQQQQRTVCLQLDCFLGLRDHPRGLGIPTGIKPTLNDSHYKPQSYFMLSLETENKLLPLSRIHFQK